MTKIGQKWGLYKGLIIECARTLGRVLFIFDNDRERIDRIRQQALKTAAEYTPDRQQEELLDFWKRICE
jgi:hypothetical protein